MNAAMGLKTPVHEGDADLSAFVRHDNGHTRKAATVADMRAKRGLFAFILFASIWLSTSGGGAEPLVRVRAESRIELGVSHSELGIVVSGALRDELGQPLIARALAIEVQPVEQPPSSWRTSLSTDSEGRFALELSDSEHDYRLLATFAGDDTHRGVRVERRVERTRADVRLELRLPEGNVIDLDAPTLRANVVAESDAGGDGIAMRLLDEAGRELSRGVTDPAGKLAIVVKTAELGEPGAGLIRIESLRDQRRAEAQTEARIVRRRAVSLSLETENDRPEAGGAIQVKGIVRTRAAPRAHVPIGLFVGTRHLETVISDEHGRFGAELWIDVAPGPLEITARAEGDAAGAFTDAEAKRQLLVGPARPLPWRWIFAALVLSALPIWLAARNRASAEEPRRADESLSGTSILPARAQGRRDRHRVHGRVLDAHTDSPLHEANLLLIHDKEEASSTLAVDAFGRFASPVLPSGRARLRISAPGHVATETELEIPHRGEWSAFVVRLLSLRAHALLPYRRLLLKLLPSPRAWGIWTTREARDYLAQHSPTQKNEISTLTLDVERASYGAESPTDADVLSIEAQTHSLEMALAPQSDRRSLPPR
jgi:hypothetical protein